jgi:hypothetical protein
MLLLVLFAVLGCCNTVYFRRSSWLEKRQVMMIQHHATEDDNIKATSLGGGKDFQL